MECQGRYREQQQVVPVLLVWDAQTQQTEQHNRWQHELVTSIYTLRRPAGGTNSRSINMIINSSSSDCRSYPPSQL